MNGVFLTLMLCLVLGSLLSLSSYPHWFIRAWDFPRIQIVVIAIGLALLHFCISQIWDLSLNWMGRAIYLSAVLLTIFQGYRIKDYTSLVRVQAKSPDAQETESQRSDDQVRIMVSNVELENDQYELWRKTVADADPDILIVLEPGKEWEKQIEPLYAEYEHHYIYPQENWYGMALLSRLPVEKHETRFLVQDDIPSMDTTMRLNNGQKFRFIGVHPRPPEPIRDNDAKARDAELMLWGKELKEDDGPIIICGDLNDVAWSQSTRLFLRTSGLLDPRIGRGMFNTFHADHWWMRFPLDHIFHSTHFSVVNIQRLSFVGSDHFPILIDLQFTPEQKDEQEVMEKDAGDEQQAEERIERAEEDEDLRAEPVDESK